MRSNRVSFNARDWTDRGISGRLDAAGLAARLRLALSWLERNLDLSVPPGSRFDLALHNIEALAHANAAASEASSLDVERAVANHRSAWELFLATACAAHVQYPDHPFTAERFAIVLRGAEVKEGRDRSARNIEFELTVAARLYLGGVPVFDGEPDLRVHYRDELAGFAIKRVTSPTSSQVKEAIKKAVEQIKASKMRGFIALNLEDRLKSVTARPDAPEFFAQVDAGLDEVLRFSKYYADSPYVVGLFVTSSLVLSSPKHAPNGLPELDMNLPWRYIKMLNAVDSITKEGFWENWESTLHQKLVILSHAIPRQLSDA